MSDYSLTFNTIQIEKKNIEAKWKKKIFRGKIEKKIIRDKIEKKMMRQITID